MGHSDLYIYNTLTQAKELFIPLQPGQVKMYVCGMTVYDFCHVGHARVMVAFDVIVRFLRHIGYQVKYIRNITDVDDKIFARAQQNGEEFSKLTERFIAAMHEDEALLGNDFPDVEPRATDFMIQIIQMIRILMDKEVAYQGSNGDVFFSIEKFKTYGELSKKKIEDLLAGARVEIGQAKNNPLDFVLWKMAKPGEASWSSPWGEGRPGWHIECSAMSTYCLGNTFDIHGGGPDLKFPHHENEIAQSEACTGQKFVNYWMHAGAVRVNKEKMSKSLGNFFTIREVFQKYSPEVIRFFLVSSQYRSQIDYSDLQLVEASASLDRLYQSLRGISFSAGCCLEEYTNRFDSAMRDDFNTPEALAVMFEVSRELNKAKVDSSERAMDLACTLKYLGEVLGVLAQDPEAYFKGGVAVSCLISEQDIEKMIELRVQARLEKNWAESDRIRDFLKEKGVILDDSREGTSWRRG